MKPRLRERCLRRRVRGLILRASRRCECMCLRWGRASTLFFCCCITLPATAGRWHRCCAISGAFTRRAAVGKRPRWRRCRFNMPITRCGSMRFWDRRMMAGARYRASCRSGPAACGAAGSDRPSARPCASCGIEPSRWERWSAAVWTAACWVAGACAGERCEPVHGAAGWFERAADAAWCGRGHCDREPDCGAHRQCAGRSCRVLREHACSAHGHVWSDRASVSLLAGCVRATLRLTATRSFRSSVWSRCSTLRARCRVIRCSR